MQVAIDAQHQLPVTKFSDMTRGFEQKLLQCHSEVQVNVVKFHNHSLTIKVREYLSDADVLPGVSIGAGTCAPFVM